MVRVTALALQPADNRFIAVAEAGDCARIFGIDTATNSRKKLLQSDKLDAKVGPSFLF